MPSSSSPQRTVPDPLPVTSWQVAWELRGAGPGAGLALLRRMPQEAIDALEPDYAGRREVAVMIDVENDLHIRRFPEGCYFAWVTRHYLDFYVPSRTDWRDFRLGLVDMIDSVAEHFFG